MRGDSGATIRRLCGSARLLQEWFGPAGSPALAQLVQNRGRWAKTTGRSRFPRRRQRFVQCAALVVGEVITFVISHQVDNRPLGQGCRLVEDQPSLLDMGSERAHVATVRVSERSSKRSHCPTKPVDSAKPRNDLVPTGVHWGRHLLLRSVDGVHTGLARSAPAGQFYRMVAVPSTA